MSDNGVLMLSEVTRMVTGAGGPISSRVGAGILQALSGILQERRRPLSPQAVEAIEALVTALRGDTGP